MLISCYNHTEDYMLPSISELQPRRVSWSPSKTSHNKGTQTIGIPSHNRSTQTTIQAKDIMMRNDPSILNLQENLAQA